MITAILVILIAILLLQAFPDLFYALIRFVWWSVVVAAVVLGLTICSTVVTA